MKPEVYQDLYETKLSHKNFPRAQDSMNNTSRSGFSVTKDKKNVKKQTFQNPQHQGEKRREIFEEIGKKIILNI